MAELAPRSYLVVPGNRPDREDRASGPRRTAVDKQYAGRGSRE